VESRAIAAFKTIKGTLVKFLPPIAVLKTAQGEIYLRVGPWWFWANQNCTLTPGETIETKGYKINNYFVPVEIKTSKGEIVLRDNTGFPVWRGQMRYGRGRYLRGRGFGAGGGYGQKQTPGTVSQ